MSDYEMSAEFIRANDPMVVLSLHNRIVASLNEDLNAAYKAQTELQSAHAEQRKELETRISDAAAEMQKVIDLYVAQSQELTDARDTLAWVMTEAMKEAKSNDR